MGCRGEAEGENGRRGGKGNFGQVIKQINKFKVRFKERI